MDSKSYISIRGEVSSLASKKKNNVQRYGLFPEFILGIVWLLSKFIFSKIYRIFPSGKRETIIPVYPTVYFANHVAETDIPGLSNVHCLFKKPRIKFTIPVREDMIGKHFLVKEFRPKGLLKVILGFIDSTRILPQLFKIVGAIGVKRPFKGDARELMKQGKLRDQVDRDWEVLADRIDQGKNAMMFPEGTYSEDGYLKTIKNGLAYLASKRAGLNFFYFNFTYDYLSYKKPAIHIGFGETFQIPEGMTKEEISTMVKNRLGKLFTVTPGNLTSFVVLNSQVYVGKTKEWIKDFIEELSKKIYAMGGIYVAETLREGKNTKQILTVIDMMVKKKVLSLSKSGELSLGEKWEDERLGVRSKKAKKERPFFYHRNQLRYFENELGGLL
ncbi:MAG: 1-acyl-sn-glycerol-3-phosphate acyltransferase [Leptospira sp.]|nr:1-acyl-sn-glycerol-3-phosphate acyltransferase [Leptospira sp.]